jgi:hypothetical protein
MVHFTLAYCRMTWINDKWWLSLEESSWCMSESRHWSKETDEDCKESEQGQRPGSHSSKVPHREGNENSKTSKWILVYIQLYLAAELIYIYIVQRIVHYFLLCFKNNMSYSIFMKLMNWWYVTAAACLQLTNDVTAALHSCTTSACRRWSKQWTGSCTLLNFFFFNLPWTSVLK